MHSFSPLTIGKGVDSLKQGKIIAYPTESVFGLGCDPCNIAALEALLFLKQRSPSKGMILIASSIDQIERYIDFTSLPKEQWLHIQSTWPGPHTWVFPVSQDTPLLIQGPNHTIALRVTQHPVAVALCSAFGGAIVSTSANISNLEPLRDGAKVFAQFGDKIAGVIAGSVGDLPKPTTVQNALTLEVYR